MITFSVDPNYSGKNLPGWFLVSSYLQKILGDKIKFIYFNNFDACRDAVMTGEIDIVYANGYDWVTYMNTLQFIPVMKPVNHFDEVLLCSGKFRSYSELPGKINILSAHEKTLVHMTGIFLLEKAEINLSKCNFIYTGNYQNVMRDLLQNKAELGFIFNEVYDNSTNILKNQLNVIDKSEDGFVFHAFCISPKLTDKIETIKTAISSFPQKLLLDIGFIGFEEITEDEIFTMSTLVEEYINNID